MSDVLSLFLRLNLAGAAAVVMVLALRLPARRIFGPAVAYALWSLVPLALLAMFVPARVVVLQEAAPMAPAAVTSMGALSWAQPATAPSQALPDLGGWLAALGWGAWAAGALWIAVRLIRRQARFVRAERAGNAGPAAVGVLRPRIVLPDDFAHRYSARECELVLAHEAAHVARHDTRVNAAAALLRCLAWCNPFAHVLARELRADQELACDARVVAARPGARRAYAEAMLKTQIGFAPLPLGCHWPAPGAHPLAQRIAALARPAPDAGLRALGAVSVALTASAAGWSAWAARPPEFVWISAPAPAAPVRLAEAPPLPAPVHPALKPRAARRTQQAVAGAAPAPAPKTEPIPPPRSQIIPIAVAAPAEGCGQTAERFLPRGDFGPARRIHAGAGWSSVEPGQAVRVYARTTDEAGAVLITDLTAFGSQRAYRMGCIRHAPSPDSLFTSVVQQGDRFRVRLTIQRDGRWAARGEGELAAGETRAIALDDGRQVDVSLIARPETPDELDMARRFERPARPAWGPRLSDFI
jgi:beta-lactamase regulating signal transducer with metallopeptidase domain